MKIEWGELRASGREYGWLWLATGLGVLIEILGLFQLTQWIVGFGDRPWVRPLLLALTCGVAPFWMFHRARRERDRASQEEPWSFETINLAYHQLADFLDDGKQLSDLIEQAADPFVSDHLGDPVCLKIERWARDVRNDSFVLLGHVPIGSLALSDDFREYEFAEPDLEKRRHQLRIAMHKAIVPLQALFHGVARERMRRERLDLVS